MVKPPKEIPKIRKTWNIKPVTKRKNSLRKTVDSTKVRKIIQEGINESGIGKDST